MPLSPRSLLASLLLTGALTACGGGGSGSPPPSSPPPPPPPVNTIPPTATISTITPAQRVTNQPVSFTGTGTTPVVNGVLTYSWVFGDGSTGSGASATHTYTTHGSYTVSLTVKDAGNLSTSTTQDVNVVAPPGAPALTVDRYAVVPNSGVTATASATDPQGSALTYSWDFGDGANGTGASASHAYGAEGSYVMRVTATNQFGLTSTSTSAPVSVAWLPLIKPSILVWNDAHLIGQTMFAEAVFVEPNGLSYTLDWTFGDGGSTTSTSTTEKLTHTYTTPGTYTVKVVATNSAGHAVANIRTVNVQPVSAQPAANDNVFLPYCAGSFCGAASVSSYLGTGVGIWRYHNSTNSDATINISINGVTAGSPATLVFSNGRTVAAASVPQSGTQSIVASQAMSSDGAAADHHQRMIEANQRMAATLSRPIPAISAFTPAKAAQRAVLRAATPLGTTRTWNEPFYTQQTYTVAVAATCTFSTGRDGVIWVDAGPFQRGEIDPVRIEGLKTTLCGTQGAYESIVALHGDIWGPAPANLVQDSATLQDLQIVVVPVPQSADFGGYFAASNLNSTATDPNSNAALSVVLNGWVFANYPVDDPSTRGTLVHELKHLNNFYQRSIVRGASHATWLEETSAMLAEDLISPHATPLSRTEARVSGYSYSLGGIGYLGWTHPGGHSYNQGGAFGTFLHRRYGASLDRELTTMCHDDGAPNTSYQCVQDYITRHGGLGFEDEFARMGASALGVVPTSGAPLGFGFPGMTIEGSAIEPVGFYKLASVPEDPPRDLNGSFGATMHTYSRTFIPPGASTYTRNNVVIPAGTTLLLVIAPPPN